MRIDGQARHDFPLDILNIDSVVEVSHIRRVPTEPTISTAVVRDLLVIAQVLQFLQYGMFDHDMTLREAMQQLFLWTP